MLENILMKRVCRALLENERFIHLPGREIRTMTPVSRRVLLLSTSTIYGSEYLQYARNEVDSFLKSNNVSQILFIPYALKDYEEYTEKVSGPFGKLGYKIVGIHTACDPVEAVNSAEALYVGGGNTFQLLKALYDKQLVEPIKRRVLEEGLPYIGSSAGSNVATASISTTNDMPIAYPPSLDALGLVPFNINPHYIDTYPDSKHMGETREERIKEFHEVGNDRPVLGLREGCLLHVEGNRAVLKGVDGARLFLPCKEPVNCDVCTDLSFLLSERC